MNRFYIFLMILSLSFQKFVFAEITWDNFDQYSQFKLIRLGVSSNKVKKWKLEHFDHRYVYILPGEDGSTVARLVNVKLKKYKVTNPLTVVSHKGTGSSSSYKDKYKNSYGTLLRSENIEQEILIEELKYKYFSYVF